METISVGGLIVKVPSEENIIILSKHTTGKYIVNLNGNPRITSTLKTHLNYRVEMYGDNNEMYAAGDPSAFSVIIGGITYSDFTTMSEVEDKIAELTTISSGDAPTVVGSGFKKFLLVGADGDWNESGVRIGTELIFDLPNEANIEKDLLVLDDENTYVLSIEDNVKHITFTLPPIAGSYIYYQL